jgi:hypothetical protein
MTNVSGLNMFSIFFIFFPFHFIRAISAYVRYLAGADLMRCTGIPLLTCFITMVMRGLVISSEIIRR